MRKPRTTKVLDQGEVYTYIYVKKTQPMVLEIANNTGETKWIYWETWVAENGK